MCSPRPISSLSDMHFRMLDSFTIEYNSTALRATDPVHVAGPSVFYPMWDSDARTVQMKCGFSIPLPTSLSPRQKKMCRKLIQKKYKNKVITPETVAIHFWVHFWVSLILMMMMCTKTTSFLFTFVKITFPDLSLTISQVGTRDTPLETVPLSSLVPSRMIWHWLHDAQ